MWIYWDVLFNVVYLVILKNVFLLTFVSLPRTIAEACCHISCHIIFAILMRWDNVHRVTFCYSLLLSDVVIFDVVCHWCCCSVLIYLNVYCYVLTRMLGKNSVYFHCPNPRTSFRPHRWSLKIFKKTSENSRKTWEVTYDVKETQLLFMLL